jgi:hypothetical protein
VSNIDINPEDGFVRNYKPGVEELIKKSREAGYKLPLPPKKVSTATAFNKLIIKPILEAVKNVCISLVQAEMIPSDFVFKLEPQFLRKLEAYIRTNTVNFPVLGAIYGIEQVRSLNQDDINKLLMKKDVKQACREMTIELIKHRNEVGKDIIKAIVEILVDNKKIPYNEDEDINDINNEYTDAIWGALISNT